MPRSPQHAYEAKLKAVDAQLRRLPGNAELKFQRARLLERLDRLESAKKAYLEVLTLAPDHFDAITNLAALLYRSGSRGDALLTYAEAVERHPGQPIAHANLAFMLLKGSEPARARTHYEIALRLDPGNLEAQRGLSATLAQLGDSEAVERLRAVGAAPSMVLLPFRGSGKPIPLLLLVTAGAGNTPTERLIDDRVFEITKLVVDLHQRSAALPQHQVIFNAIGDADSCAAALTGAIELLAGSTDPVVNSPERVLATGRALNAARLAGLGGVRTARTVSLGRASFAAIEPAHLLAEHGLSAPLLLRSPGYHTGKNFLRVERAEELVEAAASLPGETLLAIEFLDTRDAEGLFRKYRVMFVDGVLYPLHMAISPDWKVHYFSADMAERADHRAEEEAFLSDMERVLGPRAVDDLHGICTTLGLDYAGIDFGLDTSGNVVVFEANATMVLVTPKSDDRWGYRREPVERVFTAVTDMLRGKALRVASRR